MRRWSPSKSNIHLDKITMVDLIIAVFSLDHQEKAKEEFINSARRGHEDDGGEGSVSERKGDTPEG